MKFCSLDHLLCRDEHRLINCPQHQELSIDKAFWGRERDYICPRGNDRETYCSDPGILRRFQACNGRKYCRFVASYKGLGDPCPKVSKYLQLSYSCKEKCKCIGFLFYKSNFAEIRPEIEN